MMDDNRRATDRERQLGMYLSWWLQEVAENELGDCKFVHGADVRVFPDPTVMQVHTEDGRCLEVIVREVIPANPEVVTAGNVATFTAAAANSDPLNGVFNRRRRS